MPLHKYSKVRVKNIASTVSRAAYNLDTLFLSQQVQLGGTTVRKYTSPFIIFSRIRIQSQRRVFKY